MERFRQMLGQTHRLGPAALELAGALLVIAGLFQIYEPAAFIFTGAAIVFIAQGMERDE
ncbi:MAG: hypothetical protein L6Q80_08080 [Dehalococcoidia bacterium]|nr:hypothetical protein [Dehalococcoidia bacterium]